MFHLSARVLLIALLLSLAASTLAGTSLKLSTTLPGWDRERSGPTFDAATDLARGYARQLGRVCSMPEVFVRDQSSSIRTALLFYENYLPYGAIERVLLDGATQRVALIASRMLITDVMSVMLATRSGVVLVLC